MVGEIYEYSLRKTLDIHHTAVLVDDGRPLTFTIRDSWGDGICCHRGLGGYRVVGCSQTYAEGGEFGSSESTSFVTGTGIR